MMNRQKEINECRKHFQKATGKIIKKRRKQKNITQKKLGEVLCVSDTTIGRYEKGTIDIPASSLPIISGFCDFPMRDYLLSWEEISVESMIRDALKVQTDSPDEKEIEYIVKECTEEEANEILSLGLSIDYIIDVQYKNELLTVMLEHHITKKQNKDAHERIKKYYEMITGKCLKQD